MSENSLKLAATAWCSEKTASTVMDTELCHTFADILDEVERILEERHEAEMNAAIKVIHDMMRAEISFNEGESGASLEITKAYRAADKFLEGYYSTKEAPQ